MLSFTPQRMKYGQFFTFFNKTKIQNGNLNTLVGWPNRMEMNKKVSIFIPSFCISVFSLVPFPLLIYPRRLMDETDSGPLIIWFATYFFHFHSFNIIKIGWIGERASRWYPHTLYVFTAATLHFDVSPSRFPRLHMKCRSNELWSYLKAVIISIN